MNDPDKSHSFHLNVGPEGLPPDVSVDVLVIGGGTAGVAAALAAARNGARTLIIESQGYLGGSQTGALVTPIMNYHCGSEPLVRGIHEEMVERVNASGRFDGVWHAAEALKLAYEEMAQDSHVGLRYYAQVVDSILDGRTLTGVVIASKNGLENIHSRLTIDCTGDADVAHFAGAPCVVGRERDGVNQPASLRFIAGGIDTTRLAQYLRENDVPVDDPERIHVGYCRGGAQHLRDLWEQGTERGELLPPRIGVYIQFFTMPGCPGMVSFNCPRITRVRGTDGLSLTRAAVIGRKRAHKILEFCRRHVPGFEQAFIAQTAPMVGIRESRRIVGEYALTVDDVLKARKFTDAIARSNYPVDIHNPDAESGGVTLTAPPEGDYYEIPYRCLVPREIDNLLVAGRCVSATFEAQAAVRVQATCRALGEAAGTAAALCREHGVTPRRLDPTVLLRCLHDHGAAVASAE